MEVTGFGIAIVVEALAVAQSINTRIGNYSQGREEFKSLNAKLAHLTQNVEEVYRLLRKFPQAIPDDIRTLFDGTLDRVRESLLASDASIEAGFSKAFAGSSKSLWGSIKLKAYRVFRATELKNKMKAVEVKLDESSNQLLHLISMLVSSLSMLERKHMLVPAIENRAIFEFREEEYYPAISAPALAHTVNLDFATRNAQGSFAAPEGELKDTVLSSASSAMVTAATGVASHAKTLYPAYGVVGMAGVGKTVALQGLAFDDDICGRFPDGVHYMSFGQGATAHDAIQEIVRIMTLTGASVSTSAVRSSTSVREAVDYALPWFQGKTCLFLVDDLWPTERCPTGYLNDLLQLLRGSPGSRMAISTRNLNIALRAGSVVDFGARAPLEAVSVKIFMAHATGASSASILKECGYLSQSVSKILTWCGGLPLALSVSGSSVAFLVRTLGSFERACNFYVTDFEERKTAIGESRVHGGPSLAEGILLSLKYLQVEFLSWKCRNAMEFEHDIIDLYTSLGILTNQVWIPVPVLGRMWKLDEKRAFDVVELFCVMCLASISFRTVGDNSSEQAGIALHDLHLEFCKMQLKSKNVECLWHLALLNGYFKGSVEPLEFSSQQLLEFIPRPWWSFETPKDTYLHGNLARHLSKAGLTLELAALLMDARWTNARGTFGGLLGLKADFDILDNVLSGSDSEKEESVSSDDIRQSFRLIFKAIQLSWGGFSDGPRAFQFQVCGRLLKLRESNVIVDAYLHSFAVYTSKPYLMPTSQFYPCLNTAQTLEIPVGGRCGCVVCSPCGQYFAAGTGCDIVIADVTTGDIVHRLQGHSDHVCCVTFMAGSKKVVSGSKDKTVLVWERESSDVPVLVLRGHRAAVTGVAVSSNEEVIFSSSRDGTLKVWNGSTGSQDREFAQGSPVLCVDIFVESRKLAIGLHNGALKVLNSLTGKAIFENAEAHTGSVTSVAFSPDGKLLATASFDMTIRLWNASTGRAIGGPVEGHSNWVTSVAFSPDGQKIVSGSHRCEGTVRLWDIGSANSVDSSSNHPALSERASFSSHSALSVTFSSRGEGIMSGSSDGIVRIWSTLFRSEPRQQVVGHIAEVRGIAISHDGLRVASGSKDKTVRLWETQTGSRIGIPLRGHTRAVCCVSFSPDGRQVVSGSEDNTLRLWDAETFSQIGDPFEGHSNWVKCVSFSTDGLRIVSGAFDKTVRLWNVQTHKQIGAPLIPDSNRVMAVSESANGHFVVSLDRYSKVSIWNRSSRSIVWKSNKGDEDSSHTIADEQADVIIRSCGQEAPHLWPNTFPTYTSEVYCKNVSVYSDVRGEATSLGNLPSSAKNWKYNEMRKVFAAGLPCGTVAISRFISKSG